jgi:hypothetical protein
MIATYDRLAPLAAIPLVAMAGKPEIGLGDALGSIVFNRLASVGVVTALGFGALTATLAL